MKIIILLLLTCLTASAQYRFNIYRYSIATNASIASNAVSTVGTSVDVGSGTEATIQIAFKQTNGTNAVPTDATNNLVSVWDTSLDGTRFTNRFSFTLKAQATTNEVWGTTNFTTEWPWLRLVNITNTTGAIVTNYSVTVGNKIGL